MTTRFPGHLAVKQTQMITPPPPCLTFFMRCLRSYVKFGFLQMKYCELWAFICSKNIGPDGLSDATLQILLCVFTEKRLSPGNLYKKKS